MYNNKKYNKKHDNGDHRTRGEKAVDKFVEMIIARMEEMKAGDWKKGWISGSGMNGMPQNISGRTYNGSNSFFLQLATANKNYKTPVFMTFLQVQKEGAHVLKGEESMPVVYWNFTIKDKETGKKIDRNEFNRLSDEEKAKYEIKPFLTAYLVYNIDQTNLKDVNKEKYDKLVEKFKPKAVKDTNGMYENAALDRLFQHQEWVCPIQVDKRSPSAYYSPSRDQIVVPMKEQFKISNTPEEIFKDGMEYYSSAIHEMAHSTGTPERLNRTKGDKFGDEKYAKEELVAELTAASVGYSMGFDPRIIDNNAAYLDGWIDTLKENHNFIVSVMADVNKAADMIIEAVDKQLIALGEKPIKGKSIEDEQEEDNKQEQPEQVAKATYNVQAINSQELSMVSEPLYQRAPDNNYAQTDDLPDQKASQTTDQSGAVTQQQSSDLTVSLQQQIADFKWATGIQLEIQSDRLIHKGDLNLFKTDIQQLPENLTVEGKLDLHASNIKELPKNLTVNGNLDLGYTPVTELQENLYVGGGLWLDGTKIQRLPDNLSVGGSLNLAETLITELPDNLTVNGYLQLSETPIKELPDNLTVNGNLQLSNTPISELPADLKVKGNIYMDDRTIKATPDIMTPDGYIDLAKAGAPIAQKFEQNEQMSNNVSPRTMEYGKNTIDAISNRAAEIIKKTFDENDIEKTVLNNERITKAANNMILKEIEKNPNIIAAPQEQKTKDDGIPDNIKDANFIGMVQVGQKGPKLYFTDEEKFNAYVEKAWESGHYLNKSIIRNNNISDSIKKDIDQNLSQQKGQNADQTIVPTGTVAQQQNKEHAQPIAANNTMAAIDATPSDDQPAEQKADAPIQSTNKNYDDQKTNLENKLFNIIKDAKGLDLKDSYGVYFILNEPVKAINDQQAPDFYKLQEDSKILGMFVDRNRTAPSDFLLYQDKEGNQQFLHFAFINKGILDTLIESFSRQKEADQLIPIMAKYIRENNTFALALPSNNDLHIADVNNVSDSDKLDSLAIQMDHKYRQAIDFQKDNGILLEKMMEASKVHALALPDGIKIKYNNGVLTVDKYKEGVKHAEFANLPKNEKNSLGWSATEIMLDTLQNTLKRYAEQTTTDLTVNLPNGDTVHLNKGNLDDTYNQLSKLEKIGVLNSFASAAEADAQILFDNALKNSKDNKIFLEPNNWIQKENDGSLSIVLVKDNETNKASLNDFNGLTQWSIVSYAIEQLNQTKIQQQIADFKETTGIQLEVRDGKPYYNGDLNLAGTNIEKLLDNLTINGKLNLFGTPIKELPEGLSVEGHLILRNTKIETLPENLTVNGYMDIQDTPIKQLPDSLSVKSDIYNSGTQIPNSDRKPDSHTLQQMAEFEKETGEILHIQNGRLVYRDNKILELFDEKLPDNLTVAANLTLNSDKINKLPKGLVIEGNLDITFANVKTLPDDIIVDGNLYVIDTSVYIPETAEINGKVSMFVTTLQDIVDKSVDEYKDLYEMTNERENRQKNDLQNTNQQTTSAEVPSVAPSQQQNLSPAEQPMASNDNAKSQGYDELTPRQKLEAIGYPYKGYNKEDGSYDIPTVNESLYWRYAAGIITLNEAAREFTKNGWTNFVDEDYTRRQFESLNQKYHKLSDDLQPLSPEQIALQKVEQQIAEFKEATGIQLEVRDGKPFYEGYLNLKDSNVQQLPENLTVNGALNLANAPIKELPENLTVKGDLYLEYTKIERLPDNLSVGGSLDLSYTPIKELPENLTISGSLWLLESEIQKLPENLTVNDSLDVEGTLITELTDLPAKLKVKGNIYMNSQTITATPDVMTPDGYIDLVKADAPIAQQAEQQANQTTVTPVAVAQQQNEQIAQQPQAEQQTTNANQKADTPSMEESPTAKEYAIMWMTSIAEKTPKDRPSDIVFVKDFSLEDPTKPIYEVYGKDADRLAEKVSSSVAAMRPEIEGQRYPNATVNSGNIEAVRADMMLNNVRPVIIDLEGNRITNDKTLDYTKEERKAFLDSLKPEAKQRQDIAETIQRLGNPDRIVVPQLYNSHSVYAGPELIVPHRFGYQEVPVLQLVKSKNGSYRAGNDDDGYYPIEKMDTNNLYEVQKALKIVENNRPQKLIEQLEKQIDSGRASVEKGIADNHYKFTIYDQQNDLHYPRGNKSFTINTEVKDKIYLHPDDKNYVTEHKVDPQLVKKLTTYAESKLNTPKKDIEATVKYSQDNWLLSAKVNGVNLQPRIISQQDAGDFKKGLISKEDLVQKTFGDLSQQQEEKRTRSMKL